jgi:hypothetical protein
MLPIPPPCPSITAMVFRPMFILTRSYEKSHFGLHVFDEHGLRGFNNI